MKTEGVTGSISPRMMSWWWLSVPYSMLFIISICLFEAFGVSVGALGHSAVILPFLFLALACSISSAVWFLVMMYSLFVTSTVRLDRVTLLLLCLSAIAAFWAIVYVTKR